MGCHLCHWHHWCRLCGSVWVKVRPQNLTWCILPSTSLPLELLSLRAWYGSSMVWDHHVAKFDAPAVDVGGRISATVQSPSALSRPAGPYFFGSNQPTGRDGPQLVRSCSVAEVPSTLTAIVDSTLPHPFRPPPSGRWTQSSCRRAPSHHCQRVCARLSTNGRNQLV